MKWITASDLNDWVRQHSKDAQQYMPELVEKLIYASVKSRSALSKMRIPVGDKTYLKGFDGVVECSENIYMVPAGTSVWEIGTDIKYQEKAESDFKASKNKENWIDRETATFVFITPRTWNGSKQWEQQKRILRQWKDVRVFTDIELEHWLEQCPSAALWLASKIKDVDTANVVDLETYWMDWASSESVSIPRKMLIGGRNQETQQLIDSFKSPSVITIHALSKSEAMAFAVAACLESSDADAINSRAVVVKSDDAMKRIVQEYENLIIIADVNNMNYSYATRRGHTVIYATGDDFIQGANNITLPRISRQAFLEGMIEMGMSKIDAGLFMFESMRDMMVVRRKYGMDQNKPEWVTDENMSVLVSMFLLGKWKSDSEGDQQMITRISGDCDAFMEKANLLKNKNDAPIVNIENRWRLKSAYDIFAVLARYILPVMLEKYKDITTECLSDIDPDAIEKANSNGLRVWKEKRTYSMWLKEGLLQTAIQIAIHGTDFGLPEGQEWIDHILGNVLKKAGLAWWLSNQHLISNIAEASPTAFLNAIDRDTKGNSSVLREVFETKAGDILFSSIKYTEILWALESLAWDEKYLPKVTELLFRLSDFKTDKGYANQPINSLNEIYKIWHPQTYASTEEKRRIFEVLAEKDKYRQKIFKFCFRLVDSGLHDVASPTAHFKWRYAQSNHDLNGIKMNDVFNAERFLVQLMLKICDGTKESLSSLIKIATNTSSVPVDIRQNVQEYISSVKEAVRGDVDICDEVRKEIRFNNVLKDEDEKLTDTEETWLIQLLKDIEPEDVEGKNAWLFSSTVSNAVLLEPVEIEETHKARWEKLRLDAIKQLKGNDEIFAYSLKVKEPSTLGETFGQLEGYAPFGEVLKALHDKTIDPKFANGFFVELLNKTEDISEYLHAVNNNKEVYPDDIIFPLLYASFHVETLDYVDTLSDVQQKSFWSQINVYSINKERVVRSLEKLLQYERYSDAITLCGLRCSPVVIPAALIKESMDGWLVKGDSRANISYEVAKLIVHIDGRDDISQNDKVHYEFLLYNWIKNNPTSKKLTFNRLMETDGEFMYSLLRMYYLPEVLENNPNKDALDRILLDLLLFKLPPCPYISDNGEVNEEALLEYITTLRAKAKSDGISDKVDSFIGRLLAQGVLYDSVPNIICKIVDGLDNEHLNQGFEIQLFNKNSFSSRGPFDGGTVERSRMQRFAKIADALRIEYPITAKIFDDLCKQYESDARHMDHEAELTDVESL